MAEVVLHIHQHTLCLEVHVVLLCGLDELVAGLLQVTDDVEVAPVEVTQVGVVGVLLQSGVYLALGGVPRIGADVALRLPHIVAGGVQFFLGSGGDAGQQEHCEQQGQLFIH